MEVQKIQLALPLPEFVERTDGTLARFCVLMAGSDCHLDDIIERVYRRFSKSARRDIRLANRTHNLEVELYHSAMKELSQLELERPRLSLTGRDNRVLKAMETDLLSWWRAHCTETTELGNRLALVGDRLRLLDFDLRAPVILHDHLAMDSESILKVLHLRWAVFRHRLHRGRVEFQKALQGVQLGATMGPKAGR